MRVITLARLRSILATSALTASILALAAGYGYYRFGSIAAATQYIRGERLLTDGPVRSLGQVPVSGKVTIDYTLTNRTGQVIKLLGSKASCSCAMVGDLPPYLDSNSSLKIQVVVTAPPREQDIMGTVDIYTDEPHYHSLELAFTGRAVASRGSLVASQ